MRSFGGAGHEIWNVADPSKPVLVSKPSWNLKDTHKSFWECDTGIAYLVSGVDGWRSRRMTEVFDLSDPAKPVKIRDFGLVGQEPGTSGTVPTDLHGMISTGPQGNRIYFGYGTNKGGVVQIVDREKLINGPKEPTPENLRSPIVRQIDLLPISGAHTTVPLLGVPVAEFAKDKDGKVRDFIMIVNEQILNECLEPRQMVYFMDVTIELRPMVVSNFNVPEASGNFCGRGGRFGSHSANESTAPVFHKKVAFFTWFNGGVRAVDIRDPYQPKEIGYFIPSITEATDKRCIKVDGKDRCKTAIQSNNLETDDRGYVYVVDRANTGMHVLELTGEARKVSGPTVARRGARLRLVRSREAVGGVEEFIEVDAAARHRNVELAGAHHRPRIENDAEQALLQRLRRDRLDQEFVHAEPDRGRHPRLQSDIGQHDDRQVRLGKDARRAHDAHDLAPVQHRHVPIHDHDVGIDVADGVERARRRRPTRRST